MAFRELQGRPCTECEKPSIAACERCSIPLCTHHAPRPNERCEACEQVRREKLAILDIKMDMLADGKRIAAGVTAMGLCSLVFGIPMAVKLPMIGLSLLCAGVVVTVVGGVSFYRSHTATVAGEKKAIEIETQFLSEKAARYIAS